MRPYQLPGRWRPAFASENLRNEHDSSALTWRRSEVSIVATGWETRQLATMIRCTQRRGALGRESAGRELIHR